MKNYHQKDIMARKLWLLPRMSNAERNVSVKSFSGATLNDMSDFLKPTGRKQPDKLVIHAGQTIYGVKFQMK